MVATAVVVGSAVAAMLATLLALAVARLAPHAPLRRPLVTLLLLIAAIQALTAGSNVLPPAANALIFLLAAFMFSMYLRLLRHLETPWVRWLRERWVMALVTFALLVAPLGFAGTLLWHLGRGGAVETFWGSTPAPLYMLLFAISVLVVAVYALSAAISAWRRAAPGSPEQARARAFALAFGVHDAFIVAAVVPGRLVALWDAPLGDRIDVAALVLIPLGAILAMVLLSYGILRTQLFDIDARTRLVLSRSSVATAFVVLYVLASQAFAAIFTPSLGMAAALALTAALVLSMVPLQRRAERFFGAIPARPGDVEDRVGLYLATMEELRIEGDPHAEATLAALASRLGLTERERAIIAHAARTGKRPSWSSSLHAGERVLGRYRIERVLGDGSQGSAWLARDERLDRNVVIKQFRRAGAAALREGRALARVHHPNVAAAFDVHPSDEGALLVTEFVDGEDLQTRLRRGPVPAQDLRRIAVDIFEGIAAIHDAGLVHRDVKPSNILLTREGRAKVADLGIAAAAESAEETRSDGTPRGSARYMAPEQATGGRATAASDQYSAALVLFEALTGEPYIAREPGDDAALVMRRAQAPPARRVGSPGLDRWFQRALAVQPDHRFPSVRDARRELIVELDAGGGAPDRAIDSRP